MRKPVIFITLIAITFITVAEPRDARAAEACDLRAQVHELIAIQSDTALNESEQLEAEIVARRKLLEAAIDCDKRDIASRVEAFAEMPDDMKLMPAYREILEGMMEISRYYEERKSSIQEMRFKDLKNVSRTMAAWRKETYMPLVTWADNFLIWADNQQFLERASARLEQASRVAFSLKLVNQDEVNGLFEMAKGSFETALAENGKAKEALDQKRPANALTHTQSSLRALADTYQIFFRLQEALQKIVK